MRTPPLLMIAVLLFHFVGLHASPIFGQTASLSGRGRVLGVFDEQTGQVIAGARVTDKLTGSFALTTETGTVSLAFVKANGSYVEISKAGYLPVRLIVDPADTTPITIVLKPGPTVLNAATGVGGFSQRCASRRVTCLTEDDFAKKPAARLSDFLVRADGVIRHCHGSTSDCVVTMRSTVDKGECSPAFFLDGDAFLRALPEYALADLENLIHPIDIRGVEVYRPDQPIPLEFDRSRGCGAIAIWRK